jgi:hypothetical protein
VTCLVLHSQPFFGLPSLLKNKSYGPHIFDQSLQLLICCQLKEVHFTQQGGKRDFHLETCYGLLPDNANSFAANLKKFSKQFGYGFLLNIPTTGQTDANNANNCVYSNQINMLKTWNRATKERIAINANKIWGTRSWSQGPNTKNQIAELTQACGKLGIAQTVTLIVRKKFLDQWKSTTLSHQIIHMLTPEAQVAFKIHKNRYQWTDYLPNETIDDCCSLINKVLKLMRLDVQMNVYAETCKNQEH